MATTPTKMPPLGLQPDSLRRDAPRNGGRMIKNRCNERRRRSIESRRVKQHREIGRKCKKISDLGAPQICTPQKKWPDASTAMLSLCGSRVSQFVGNSVVVEEPSHALSQSPNEKSTDESSPCSHDCTPTDPKAHCSVVWSNAAYLSELNSDGGSTSSSERCFSHGLAEALINDQRGDSDISGGNGNCGDETLNCSADISDFRSPEPGCGWMDCGCTGESVGSAAVVDHLGSLSSTKKALIEYPEFRDPKLEDRREDLSPTVRCDKADTEKSLSAYSGANAIENSFGEGWVHGPECDIENDLSLAKLEAELEDEVERKLEEELETDIAALSQKLAHLHARQEAKQINQGNPVLKSTSLAAQTASNSISSGKPVSGKFLRPSHKPGAGNKCMVQEAKVKRPVKAADSKKRHEEDKANGEMQGNVVSKGDKADRCMHDSKSEHDTVCGKTVESLRIHGDVSRCIEEQRQSLKLSPFLWRRNFDWVKSLRSGGLANPPLLKLSAKASEVESRKEGIARTVLAEKNCESSSRLKNVHSKHESLSRGKKHLLQENRILQGPSGAPHLLNKLPKQPTPVAKRDTVKTPTKSKQPSTARQHRKETQIRDDRIMFFYG